MAVRSDPLILSDLGACRPRTSRTLQAARVVKESSKEHGTDKGRVTAGGESDEGPARKPSALIAGPVRPASLAGSEQTATPKGLLGDRTGGVAGKGARSLDAHVRAGLQGHAPMPWPRHPCASLLPWHTCTDSHCMPFFPSSPSGTNMHSLCSLPSPPPPPPPRTPFACACQHAQWHTCVHPTEDKPVIIYIAWFTGSQLKDTGRSRRRVLPPSSMPQALAQTLPCHWVRGSPTHIWAPAACQGGAVGQQLGLPVDVGGIVCVVHTKPLPHPY